MATTGRRLGGWWRLWIVGLVTWTGIMTVRVAPLWPTTHRIAATSALVEDQIGADLPDVAVMGAAPASDIGAALYSIRLNTAKDSFANIADTSTGPSSSKTVTYLKEERARQRADFLSPANLGALATAWLGPPAIIGAIGVVLRWVVRGFQARRGDG